MNKSELLQWLREEQPKWELLLAARWAQLLHGLDAVQSAASASSVFYGWRIWND